MDSGKNVRSMLLTDDPKNSDRDRREVRPRQVWGPIYGPQKNQAVGSQSMVFEKNGGEPKGKQGFEHFPFSVTKNMSGEKVASSGEFR